MNTIEIEESGMLFGPFQNECFFYIEKDSIYQKIQHSIKMAEFLLLKNNNDKLPIIWVVEAKSSTPKPMNEKIFNEFIKEIREKLTNALSLSFAVLLKRHDASSSELPVSFYEIDLSKVGFRFILVINNHKREWLPPLQDLLVQEMKSVIKTWALPPTSVTVMNDEMARNHGLIKNIS